MKINSHRNKVSFIWGALVGAALMGMFTLSAHAGDLPLIHGSLQVEDTVGADVLEASTAVLINGEIIGSATGGLWSQSEGTRDIYFDLGNVGIHSSNDFASIANILNSSLVVGNLATNFGTGAGIIGTTTAGLNLFTLSYARASVECVTDNGFARFRIRFIDDFTEPMTVFDVTASLVTISKDLLLQNTLIDGDLTLTGDAEISGTVNAGSLSTNGTIVSVGDISSADDITASDSMQADLIIGATFMTSRVTPTDYDDYQEVAVFGGPLLVSPQVILLSSTTSQPGFFFKNSESDTMYGGVGYLNSNNTLLLYVAGQNAVTIDDDNFTIAQNLIVPSPTSANIPLSSNASGTAGTIIYATNYVYVCKNTNQWVRAALSSW